MSHHRAASPSNPTLRINTAARRIQEYADAQLLLVRNNRRIAARHGMTFRVANFDGQEQVFEEMKRVAAEVLRAHREAEQPGEDATDRAKEYIDSIGTGEPNVAEEHV